MADKITDNSNVTAPVSYAANTDLFSADEAIANAEERRRKSTGLRGLEAKLAELKPGTPEYIKLDAKIKKKNFRRESRAIKKNIRKFGADADFSNISTEFKNNLTAGGSVGDVARRVNKRLENFLDRDTLGDKIRGNDVNRKNILEQGLKDRDEKIAEAKKLKEEQDKIIENKTNSENNILPGVRNYFDFNVGNNNISSGLNNRTFGDNNNYGIDFGSYSNLLPGINLSQYNTKTFQSKDKNEPVLQKKGKRPFIANVNSITAGKPIKKMLKNFR